MWSREVLLLCTLTWHGFPYQKDIAVVSHQPLRALRRAISTPAPAWSVDPFMKTTQSRAGPPKSLDPQFRCSVISYFGRFGSLECKANAKPKVMATYLNALLLGDLEHEFYFFIYWECHHPNWRIHIFRGVGLPPTSKNDGYIIIYCINSVNVTIFFQRNYPRNVH